MFTQLFRRASPKPKIAEPTPDANQPSEQMDTPQQAKPASPWTLEEQVARYELLAIELSKERDHAQNLGQLLEEEKKESASCKKRERNMQQKCTELRDEIARLKAAAEESRAKCRAQENDHRQKQLSVEDENARLKRAEEESKRNKSLLEDENTALRREMEKQHQTAKLLHANTISLKKTVDEHRRKGLSLEREISRLKLENSRLERTRNATRSQYEKADALLRKYADQDKKVELAHSVAKAIMDKNRTYAASDLDIRAWFNNRGQSWYGWARDFANPNLGTFSGLAMSPEDKKVFLSAISPFVDMKNGELPPELACQKRTTVVLLHALLANFICNKIIWSPFWYLEAISRVSGERLPTQDTMEGVYDILTSLREPEAHQWRSSMARIMALSGMGQTSDLRLKGSSNDNLEFTPYRRQYAQYLVRDFLDGAPRFLMRNDISVNCTDRLDEEMDNALKFSIGLWSGRSSIEMLDLSDFQTRYQGRFKLASDDMELYRGNNGAEVTAYENQPILVVVQPAIVAVGTEEGTDYKSARRVWMKAQVSVLEPTGNMEL